MGEERTILSAAKHLMLYLYVHLAYCRVWGEKIFSLKVTIASERKGNLWQRHQTSHQAKGSRSSGRDLAERERNRSKRLSKHSVLVPVTTCLKCCKTWRRCSHCGK